MQVHERYILMLEDDPDDRDFTRSVMEELDTAVPIVFLSHTEALFPTLEQQAPILIITDFNLHPETGIDILKKIRQHPNFQHIPVVVLGDTTEPDFIATCYRHGANTYAVKPSTMEATRNKIGLFLKYWLEVAQTPTPIKENV